MATFPTPFAGKSAVYPVTIAKRYPVAVLKFTDASEQRYRQSAAVHRFVLQVDQATRTEKDAISDFFETVKGSFDATWDMNLGGVSYLYLAFADDKMTATESSNGIWSLTVNIVQTRKN